MVQNDNVFTVIKEHMLPVSRNDLPIDDFLNKYFIEYIESLELALKDTCNCFLSKEFYKKLSDRMYVIKELCNDILKIYQLYNMAQMQELYSHLDDLMCKVEKYLYIREIDITKNRMIPNFYRIREGNDKEYSRKDLFHIPLDKRQLIKSYRYSIAGYPCLYLADSIELCWFECGMPKKFSISQFKFEPQDNAPLRLIDFSKDPIDLISSAPINYYNYPDKHDLIDDSILNYLISLPLRAACSINVIDRNTPFIQEYILPQLLLLWVRKNNKLDGVAYLTASSIEVAHEWKSFNIALPAKNIEKGYCEKLLQMFKVSQPAKSDISQLFKNDWNKVQTVRNFTRKLESICLNRGSLYLYREILSLCKTFILIYDCIVSENYKDSEVLYQMMDTLTLMAYIIKENKSVFEEAAVLREKSYYTELSNEEIKKEFGQVIDEFSQEIKPVLVNFWGYVIRISCDSKISVEALEYI